jgi:hypothetical protein
MIGGKPFGPDGDRTTPVQEMLAVSVLLWGALRVL